MEVKSPECFPPTIPWKLQLYNQALELALDPTIERSNFFAKSKTEKRFLESCAGHLDLYYYPKKAKKDKQAPNVYLFKRTRKLQPGRFCFDNNSWAMVESNPQELHSDHILLVSFNILFGSKKVSSPTLDPIYTEKRIPALFALLEKTNADIIALQEVEPILLNLLLQLKWVQDNYYISDVEGYSCFPHGNLLLSKFPFHNMYIHNYKQENCALKKMILAEFIINSRKFSLGVVHLKAGVEVDIRKGQVAESMELQKDVDDALLIGDFNFREAPNEPIEDTQLKTKYHDMWQQTHPGEDRDAYTFNLEENTIAAIVSQMATKRTGRQGRSFRYDRMYICSTHWQVNQMSMLGTEPIAEKTHSGRPIFVSDHYGLQAEIVFHK